MTVRLLYVQFAGDFREALERRRSGARETYYGQDYSVDAVLRLAPSTESTSIVCCVCSEAYDEVRPEGVRTIGLGQEAHSLDIGKIVNVCERSRPTHIVLRFPHRKLLRRILALGVKVFPLFADSFESPGWLNCLRYRFLARELNRRSIEFIANHQVGAARSLQRIGVDPGRIVPYDWVHNAEPVKNSAKSRNSCEPLELFFVGTLTETKGIGDLIRAVGTLKARGERFRLKVAGSGEVGTFAALAKESGVSQEVRFLGRIERAQVMAELASADLSFVLSHRAYPEGLPMTICESLVARTPVVVSDHPMFERFEDGEGVVMVPQESPDQVANAMLAIARDPELYARLSESTLDAWVRIQIPIKWHELVEGWLEGGVALERLRAHSLAAVAY